MVHYTTELDQDKKTDVTDNDSGASAADIMNVIVHTHSQTHPLTRLTAHDYTSVFDHQQQENE